MGERIVRVTAPLDQDRRLLVADIRAMAARSRKADAGDTADIVRFEALCSELEAWAFTQVGGANVMTVEQPESELGSSEAFPGALSDATITVDIRLPFASGGSTIPITERAPIPSREAWRSQTDAKGLAAVVERFERQCADAVAGTGATPPRICPSGIGNSVLTEVLRKYVAREGDSDAAVSVPVEYRDGSRPRRFPFRAIPLRPDIGGDHSLELRISLLSMRHVEMDVTVDGAWLRNAEVSKNRKIAETDEYVFQTSLAQLRALTDDGRRSVRIDMYQTGLEAAVIGFYRALAEHLVAHPGSVSVIPVYFRSASTRRRGSSGGYVRGTPWSSRLGSR